MDRDRHVQQVSLHGIVRRNRVATVLAAAAGAVAVGLLARSGADRRKQAFGSIRSISQLGGRHFTPVFRRITGLPMDLAHRTSHVSHCVVMTVLLISLSGCASTARDLGGAAAGGAVPAALAELRRSQNQLALLEVTGSPPAERSLRTVGAGLGRGMVDEFVSAISGGDGQVDGANLSLEHPTYKLQQRISSIMTEDVEPAVKKLVRTSVREAMSEALSPEFRADAKAMAREVGDGAAAGMSQALVRDTAPLIGRLANEQLGPEIDALLNARVRPAVRDWLRQDLAPIARETALEVATDALKLPTGPDVAPAVVANSRNLALGAGYGSYDAAINLGLLAKNGGLTARAKLILSGLATVLGVCGLGAAALLIELAMIIRTMRRHPGNLPMDRAAD